MEVGLFTKPSSMITGLQQRDLLKYDSIPQGLPAHHGAVQEEASTDRTSFEAERSLTFKEATNSIDD